MIIGKHKKLDIDKLKVLIPEVYANGIIWYHKTNTHQQAAVVEKFWANNPGLWEYIEQNTYPEDRPIENLWFKLYTSETKLGSASGEFIGLHQDKYYEYPEDKDSLIHTNSVLLERSDDTEGGYHVLAGDHEYYGDPEKRFKDSRDLMSRLIVENITEPGQNIVWNGWTMHGVSEMKSGKKLNMIVIKKTKFDEDYFKT